MSGFTDGLADLRDTSDLHGCVVSETLVGWDLVLTETVWTLSHYVPNKTTFRGRTFDLFDSDGNHLMLVCRTNDRDRDMIPVIVEMVKGWEWARDFVNPNPRVHDGTDPTFVWQGLKGR